MCWSNVDQPFSNINASKGIHLYDKVIKNRNTNMIKKYFLIHFSETSVTIFMALNVLHSVLS